MGDYDDWGVSIGEMYQGATVTFWCIFSFVLGLILASWHHSLLIYLVYAIALFFIGGYIHSWRSPWHWGEASLSILFGVFGVILGKGLINKHAA